MLPLRFPWLWLLLGWTLIVGVCIASLMPANDLPSLGVSDKVEHASSYFLLTIWFTGLYPRARYAWLALGLFLLGAMLDVLQLGTATRDFDLLDITADGVGVLIALLLAYTLVGGWCQRMESWLAPPYR
ncbi:MAG TPA: VanZ family protein [Gammaproteobacteria bacterium]|nr:VanZ family protein [Gammaproteobacteria bacterium]